MARMAFINGLLGQTVIWISLHGRQGPHNGMNGVRFFVGAACIPIMALLLRFPFCRAPTGFWRRFRR